MSNAGFFARLLTSVSTAMRTGLWFTLLVAVAVLSLVIVGLTFGSEGAAAAGTDAGRMALSFAIFLALIATVIGIPTVFISSRDNLGRLPFIHSFLLAVTVGLSFLVATFPALLLSILWTNVAITVWGPVLGTLTLQIGTVSLLVALPHWAIRTHTAATATAFGLVAGVAFGPLLVLAGASVGTPVLQTTTSYYVEWKDGDQEIDPDTGFPVDPVCPSPSFSKQYLTDYSGVWTVMGINPVVLVSSSITPEVDDYEMPGYSESDGTMTMIVPLDLFGTVDLSIREMQLPIEKQIDINECENLEKYGTPYPTLNGEKDPRDVIAATRSGFGDGLVGQAIYVSLASAVLVGIRLRARKA